MQTSTQQYYTASSGAPQQMWASSRAPQQFETPVVGGGYNMPHSVQQARHVGQWQSGLQMAARSIATPRGPQYVAASVQGGAQGKPYHKAVRP